MKYIMWYSYSFLFPSLFLNDSCRATWSFSFSVFPCDSLSYDNFQMKTNIFVLWYIFCIHYHIHNHMKRKNLIANNKRSSCEVNNYRALLCKTNHFLVDNEVLFIILNTLTIYFWYETVNCLVYLTDILCT